MAAFPKGHFQLEDHNIMIPYICTVLLFYRKVRQRLSLRYLHDAALGDVSAGVHQHIPGAKPAALPSGQPTGLHVLRCGTVSLW